MQWPSLSPDLLAASDLDGHHSHRDPQRGGEHFCGTGKVLGRRSSFSALAAEPAQRVFSSLPKRPVSLHGPASRTTGISLSQTEAPLLIRPYLADMTRSEIHAVMTGGFSTIAGSVMGAYISFGVSARADICHTLLTMGSQHARPALDLQGEGSPQRVPHGPLP